MTATLPPLVDHRAARSRLLAQAEAAGGRLTEHRHPLAGPDGRPVATDVVRFGAPAGEARSVVVVASGTHGVEGHLGSALQSLALDQGWFGSLPPGVAVVLVHAVNPFGMAWDRRVDHDNIDVNRNFVDFDGDLPANPHYAEVDALLNPTELDLDDTSWMVEVLAFTERVGAFEGYRTLSGGQYDHPAGVQFGGQAPSWSRRTLARIWADELAGARTVVHVDVHSGLGPCGQLTMFQTADEGEEAADAAADAFGVVLRSDRPTTADPVSTGILGPGLDAALPSDVLVVPVVAEFGTQDVPVVFGAMRADNWLHQHGDPASDVGERIRTQMRDAFWVDDEAWRTRVAEDGLRTIRAALDAVT